MYSLLTHSRLCRSVVTRAWQAGSLRIASCQQDGWGLPRARGSKFFKLNTLCRVAHFNSHCVTGCRQPFCCTPGGCCGVSSSVSTPPFIRSVSEYQVRTQLDQYRFFHTHSPWIVPPDNFPSLPQVLQRTNMAM
jgi:hypothetical protein